MDRPGPCPPLLSRSHSGLTRPDAFPNMAALMPVANRSDSDFGARMRQAREQRGVTLRQIADTTKIGISQLEALERNDISRLPGGIFSRAFVRSYAAEIGVDPEQTVREFLAQFPHDSITAGSPHVIVDELGPGTR